MDTDIQPLSFYHRAIFCVVNVSMSVREQELRFAPFCLPLINIILLIYSSSSSFFCASLRLLIFSPLSLLSCSLAYPLHFPLPPSSWSFVEYTTNIRICHCNTFSEWANHPYYTHSERRVANIFVIR